MREPQSVQTRVAARPDVATGADALPTARRTPWRFRRRRLADLGTWPFRVGICALLAVLTGIAALQQRGALDPPQWVAVALVALAVLPWLLDLLVAVPPPWVFAPAVIVPVAVLHDPTRPDALPFLLAILALDMGLQLGPARSAPIVLVAAGVPAWQSGTVAAGAGHGPVDLLVVIAAGWLVGLALHSQVQRVARLQRTQRTVAQRAAATEHARVGRDVDALLRGRIEELAGDLTALRDDVERGRRSRLDQGLSGAEHRARELLAVLDAYLAAAPEATAAERSRDA